MGRMSLFLPLSLPLPLLLAETVSGCLLRRSGPPRAGRAWAGGSRHPVLQELVAEIAAQQVMEGGQDEL